MINTERIYEIENRLMASCPVWELRDDERKYHAFWVQGILEMTEAIVEELKVEEELAAPETEFVECSGKTLEAIREQIGPCPGYEPIEPPTLDPAPVEEKEPKEPEKPKPKKATKTKEKRKDEFKQKKVDVGKLWALRDAGWSVAKIADELRCSEKTVYYHMSKGRPEVKPYEEPADDLRDL